MFYKLAVPQLAALASAPTSKEPWPDAPLPVADGVLLTPEDERVVAFRAQTGKLE